MPFSKTYERVSSALVALDVVIMLFYLRYRLYLFGMWFYYSWADGSCLQYAPTPFQRALQLFYNPVVFFLLCISVWWLRTMLTKTAARAGASPKPPERAL